MKGLRLPIAFFPLLALVLLFPVPASAGGDKEKEPKGEADSVRGTNSKSGAKQEGMTKPEPVTLSVLLSDDVEGKGIHDGADEFFRRTGVRVHFTVVKWDDMEHLQAMALVARTPAYDAVISDARMVAEYGKNGMYADLSGVVPAGGADVYVDGLLGPALVNNGMFGVPIAGSWTVAFVNTRILEEAGLGPGRFPATWQDLVKTGKLLKSRAVYVLTDSLKPGESTTSTFFRWAKSAGARVWERRGERVYWTLDSQECMEAVLFLKKLLYDGLMDPGVAERSEEDCLEQFRMGSAAMFPGRDVLYRSLNGRGSVPGSSGVAAAPFPGARQGLSGAVGRHRFLSVPSSARNEEQVRSFIRFIASRAESRRRAIEDGMAPVFRDLFDDPDVRANIPADAVLASAGQCVVKPAIPQYGQISEVISDAVQDILVNDRDPAAVLSEAARSANRLSGW